ncbi:hypothetical protein C8R47DRAFT_51081 [Mycena vitilis]|nr:hypothetical protein C8R47DRAFT_51081 [Mycena vitilis]
MLHSAGESFLGSFLCLLTRSFRLCGSTAGLEHRNHHMNLAPCRYSNHGEHIFRGIDPVTSFTCLPRNFGYCRGSRQHPGDLLYLCVWSTQLPVNIPENKDLRHASL